MGQGLDTMFSQEAQALTRQGEENANRHKRKLGKLFDYDELYMNVVISAIIRIIGR